MANRVLDPPYTPGFGRRPPVVAGRDGLVDDVARVLEAGPEHPRFCRAILGSRGTGKTVLLDVFGEVAAKELGWAVLHVQGAARREPGGSPVTAHTRVRPALGAVWPGFQRAPGPAQRRRGLGSRDGRARRSGRGYS